MAMKEKGVLEKIINTLNDQRNRASFLHEKMISRATLMNFTGNKRLLHVKLLGGKAFFDNLNEGDEGDTVCFLLYILF